MKIVITGEIGAGKSTAIRELCGRMASRKIGGFLTTAPVEDGVKTGLSIESIDGQSRFFAPRHPADRSASPAWTVDLELFNRDGVDLIRRAANAELLIMDELGIMEMGAEPFVRAVAAAFALHDRVIAVIQKSAWSFWAAVLGARSIDLTIVFQAHNRDAVPDWLANLCRGRQRA